jgi:hypothetical protein
MVWIEIESNQIQSKGIVWRSSYARAGEIQDPYSLESFGGIQIDKESDFQVNNIPDRASLEAASHTSYVRVAC